MGKRRNHYKPKSFESKGEKYRDHNGTLKADTSANIYESMLTSKPYLDLKTRQKMLYVICKSQYYGKRKPSMDFKDIEQLQSNDLFYLNLDSVVRYGVYTKNMRKEFYSDMKALCEHGFIRQVVKGGGNGKTKSIYQFTSDWKTWSKE